MLGAAPSRKPHRGEEDDMAVQQGQQFECPTCGMQLEVKRAPTDPQANAADQPQCACGAQMQRQ